MVAVAVVVVVVAVVVVHQDNFSWCTTRICLVVNPLSLEKSVPHLNAIVRNLRFQCH